MVDSSSPQSSEDVDLARRTARALSEHMSESMKTLLAETGSIGRWITASLLAVNGAAAAAVFSAFDKLASPSGDVAFFLGGVVAALFTGVLLQKATIAGAELAGEVIGHALIVEQTGVYHEEAQVLISGMAARSRRSARWPQLAGWLSAMLFSAGAVVTGLTGFKIDIANDRRCLALQRDILSAQPRKTNAVALFQAFGCRPQGPGSVYAPRADDKY
jgi:hypothetical protein